jgi:dTDP-4-amino-4,6-dideoxygalactose transaminase
MKAGEKTIMPAYSFVATASSTVHWGGKPVFVDIEPRTYNIDTSKIIPAIDSDTRALVVVHQFGFPANMDQLLSVADKHSLHVVEDAACSLGSTYRNRKTGSFGRVACLSFHPRKIVTTGEGGMILTDSEEIARRVRRLRNHGLEVPDNGGPAECREIGYNYRMTDIQAAIGIVQFRKLDEIIRLRTTLAERYMQALSNMSELRLPEWPQDAIPNFQSFAVELARDSLDVATVIDFMKSRGIECSPGIRPIHLEPAYAEEYSHAHLPETMRAAQRSLLLPLYPGMTREEQDSVIRSLKEALAGQPISKETR